MASIQLSSNILQHLKDLVHASVKDATGNITYATVYEFIMLHKNPPSRFIIKPLKSCENSLGLALMQLFPSPPHLTLRLGVQVKQSVDAMTHLPECSSLEDDFNVMKAFQIAYLQGEDQVKAAVRSGDISEQQRVPWLLFVGPYWMPVTYGPFNDTQRNLGKLITPPRADYLAMLEAAREADESNPNLPKRPLYLLGTQSSTDKLESIIAGTDATVEHFQGATALS